DRAAGRERRLVDGSGALVEDHRLVLSPEPVEELPLAAEAVGALRPQLRGGTVEARQELVVGVDRLGLAPEPAQDPGAAVEAVVQLGLERRLLGAREEPRELVICRERLGEAPLVDQDSRLA